MTLDQLRRLLIAPEIIVVDLADAALSALRRAMFVEHPTAALAAFQAARVLHIEGTYGPGARAAIRIALATGA